MRTTTSTLTLAKRAFAAAGLTALIATTACQPLATITRANHSTIHHTAISTAAIPAYHSPYATRVAKPHVVGAPSVYAYPWAGDQSNGADSYGMMMRQCTSYVAWYVNSHGTPFAHFTNGPSGNGTFADATTWDSAARNAGFTVSTTPVVGSIAQWHAWESTSWSTPGYSNSYQAGGEGHVAIVIATYGDGTVDVAQYNYAGDRNFTINHVRAPRFIYVPLSAPRVG
jgi:surface antigen